jgi:hypothetical protein
MPDIDSPAITARQIKPELGCGSFAVATLLEIDFGDQTLPAVVKRFHAPDNCFEEYEPFLAVAGYNMLKDLGLKVPSVYLLIPEARSILMPFLGSETLICVGPNNPARCSVTLWGHPLLEEVPNLITLWDNLITDVTRAANQHIRIANDAQFYLWDTRNHQLDYIFADFDNVTKETQQTKSEILFSNLKAAYVSFDRFLQSNIQSEKALKIRQELSHLAKDSQVGTKEVPLRSWALPAPKITKKQSVLYYPPKFDF